MPTSFCARPQIPALLVLEDGRSFRGVSFGATGETFGEAVFSTGMSGYQETLTDPSYHRQVVVATAPHIGNTGWNDEDDESNQIWVAGYVVRDLSRVRSNWRSNRSLDEALTEQGIVGIAELDTRALTRHLRERGAPRGQFLRQPIDGMLRNHPRREDLRCDRLCLIIGHSRQSFLSASAPLVR